MARNGTKTGGRQKGTPNRKNLELRNKIGDFLESDWDDFLEDFDKLTEKEKIDVRLKLLEYHLPKLNRTENNNSIDIDSMTDAEIDRLFERMMKNKNDE